MKRGTRVLRRSAQRAAGIAPSSRLRASPAGRTWSTVLALLVATPVSGTAQAICSAPHSSPTLAQSGAIRTMPAGAGWIQLSLSGQRATEGFNPVGDRQDFIGGSEFVTRSAYLTGSYGLLEGLEIWAQLPVHRLTVDGGAGESEGSGVGGIRAAVRLGSALVGYELPVALRVGVKLPGSEFPVDPRVLPLTEGQRDFEVSLESGWTGSDVPLYVVGWVGYRWRGQNEACYESDRMEDRIETANGAADRQGVRGTPTFLIDGAPVQGAIPLVAFVELIEKRLRGR